MADALRVTVMASPAPREVREWHLVLPEGATLRDALQASGWAAGPDDAGVTFGIWGRKAQPEQLLRDLDRVEVYRPLTVDPKVARRERFQRQGSRGAGLFARTKDGKKAG